MKSAFTVKTQRIQWFSGTRYHTISLPFLFAAVIFVFTPFRTIFSQSGRGQQAESKRQIPDKPKPPGPMPKIREPENQPRQKGKGGKEGEDLIRINSDLVMSL
jgi:hypothetical protein